MEVRKEDQRDPDEKVVEIEIERLRDFKNHPFKVQADSQMKELQESIKKYGILNPLIVRPRPEGFYEIISGHRRKYAAQQLKYTKVPVIIRYMLEEDAIISMVDANLQRERISPSEKAFAYKMKYDVLKRKAGRRKCSQVDYLTGKKSVEVISEENITYIRDKGWIINDAYIEFTNKGYNESARNFPVVELWMYKYPYGDQFVYYNSSLGYPLEKVDFYIPDQATFTYNEASDTWQYTPRYNYGLNGIINENSASAKFSYPGKYRMRVTRTLIDMVYGDAKNVKLGLRLPFGVTQNAPFMSVLNGEDLKLVVKYTEKNEGE